MKKLEELGISPAPWKIIDSYQFPEDGEWVAAIVAKNGRTVSVPKYNNASLIAAAPETYDAAERLLRFHDESCIHGSRTFAEITRDYQKAWSDLRSALREASGESEVEA